MKRLYIPLFFVTILLSGCSIEKLKLPKVQSFANIFQNQELVEEKEKIIAVLEKDNPNKDFNIYFSEKTSAFNWNSRRYYIHSVNDDIYFNYYSNEEMYKDFYKKIKLDDNAVKIIENYITENYGYDCYVKIDGGREYNEELSIFTFDDSSFDILQNSLEENKDTYFSIRIYLLNVDSENLKEEKEMINDLINKYILKYKGIENFYYSFKITYLNPETKIKVNKGGIEVLKSEFPAKNIFKSYSFTNGSEDTFEVEEISFE